MNTTSTAERPEAVRRQLPPQPASVGAARGLVRELLATAERPDLVETATLLVSELVTNALLHAGTPIDLLARMDGERLRVEISDGSQHLPIRRHYAATAGTGRGMLMLEQLVDDWGVSRHRRGKTVWFHLTSAGLDTEPSVLQEDDALPRRTTAETLTVELFDMPLLLHAAWQEHAEALLREYLLASLDTEADIDPIQVHAEATDAIAVLEEQIPHADVVMDPDELMKHAAEPMVSVPRLQIEVPVTSVPHFKTLSDALESSLELSRSGQILTPATQPEIQLFRRWLCDQVVEQASGQEPLPWSAEPGPPTSSEISLPWDSTVVDDAATGVIAADDSDRIIAVSAVALEILGYERRGDLVGQRLIAIIPERYRQAHIAGFTMFSLIDRQPMLGRVVAVPALCRDGSESPVELLITAERVAEGRTVFLADIRRR